MLFDDKLSDIINILENEGVLLHPTDTIWGLAASALSETAIEKIYAIKNRERDKPCLLLVDSLKMLKKYVPHIHPRIETLLHFHTKPLTVVYPNVKNLPDYALANDGSSAIRIINDPYCKQIISLLDNPILSTSANLSGDDFPRRFEDIHPTIIQKSDFIAQHNQEKNLSGKPSVLISYSELGEINFLRT